jgi:hypothetical protein
MPRRPDICRTPEPIELQCYLRDNPAMVKNFVERRVVAMPHRAATRDEIRHPGSTTAPGQQSMTRRWQQRAPPSTP